LELPISHKSLVSLPFNPTYLSHSYQELL